MELGQAAIYSVLGLCVVFAALALIMAMTYVLRSVGKDKAPAPAAAPAAAAPAAAAPVPMGDMTAPGSGAVSVAGVNAKTAAIIMSVIAEETGRPLNQLNFVSIKEI